MRHFSGTIRIVVVHELPQAEHNALLHLFSARTAQVRSAAEVYRLRSQEWSTLFLKLFRRYRLEVTQMPDLLDQFVEETIEELLNELPTERRLKGLTAEEILKLVPAQERLKGLTAEEILKLVPAQERLKGLTLDEMWAALPPEARAALAQRFKDSAT